MWLSTSLAHSHKLHAKCLLIWVSDSLFHCEFYCHDDNYSWHFFLMCLVFGVVLHNVNCQDEIVRSWRQGTPSLSWFPCVSDKRKTGTSLPIQHFYWNTFPNSYIVQTNGRNLSIRTWNFCLSQSAAGQKERCITILALDFLLEKKFTNSKNI